MKIVTNGKKYMVAILVPFSEEQFDFLEDAKAATRIGWVSIEELDNTWTEVEE